MKASEIFSHRELLNRLSDYKESTLDFLGYSLKNEIDFNVFLPSRGKNLQRNFIWSHHQKQELIYSILKGISIGSVSILRNTCPFTNEEWKKFQQEGLTELPHFFKYEVIDGKQRIMTIIDFLSGKFSVNIDDVDFLYSELPCDLSRLINGYNIVSHEISMPHSVRMSDDEKIEWFKTINFSGTAQYESHLKGL